MTYVLKYVELRIKLSHDKKDVLLFNIIFLTSTLSDPILSYKEEGRDKVATESGKIFVNVHGDQFHIDKFHNKIPFVWQMGGQNRFKNYT